MSDAKLTPENTKNPAYPEYRKHILLDHYHCTFFLPLLGFSIKEAAIHQHYEKSYAPEQMAKAANDGGDEETSAQAQAFHYFTPVLRDILFNTHTDAKKDADTDTNTDSPTESRRIPLKEWALPNEQFSQWRLVLHPPNGTRDTPNALNRQVAVFQSVRLYRYFNGLYLLAFRVTPEALVQLQQANNKTNVTEQQAAQKTVPLFDEAGASFFIEDQAQGNAYSTAQPAYAPLQLEAWLRFTRLARQLYPSFTEQGAEGKIAPLSLYGLDSALLRQVTGQTEQTEHGLTTLDVPMAQSTYDPAESLSGIVLALTQSFFTKPVVDSLKQQLHLFDDRMFVSVAYGLAGKAHPPETLNYITRLLATTDRVEDGFTAFNHLPYSKEMYEHYLTGTTFDWWRDNGGIFIFNDMVNAYLYRGGFFRDIIACKHIPYLYDRMLVQALFYQASLRQYDDEITEKTSQLVKRKDLDGILKQRQAFITFTNQYWFREVTNQMQGKEIFRLQQDGLGVETHYQLLQEEISRTNDYLQTFYEKRISRWVLLIGIIAILPVLNDIFKTEPSLWQSVVTGLSGFWSWETEPYTGLRLLLAGLVAGVCLFFFYLPSIWSRLKNAMVKGFSALRHKQFKNSQ